MLCRKERELLSSPQLQNGLRKPAVRAVGAAPGSWSAQTEVRAAGESGPTPTAGGACGCGRGCLLCLREGSYEQTLDLTPVPESSAGPACTSSKVVPALLAPHTGAGGKEHGSGPDRLWPHARAGHRRCGHWQNRALPKSEAEKPTPEPWHLRLPSAQLRSEGKDASELALQWLNRQEAFQKPTAGERGSPLAEQEDATAPCPPHGPGLGCWMAPCPAPRGPPSPRRGRAPLPRVPAPLDSAAQWAPTTTATSPRASGAGVRGAPRGSCSERPPRAPPPPRLHLPAPTGSVPEEEGGRPLPTPAARAQHCPCFRDPPGLGTDSRGSPGTSHPRYLSAPGPQPGRPGLASA